MQKPPKLTTRERVSLTFVFLQIPFVLIYNLLVSRWAERHRGKLTPRVLFDSTARFLTSSVSIRQLQNLNGTTATAYDAFVKEAKLPPVIEDLGNEARLMWAGPIRNDRVLIYCHGGGFMGPLSDFQIALWHRVQKEILKRPDGKEIGVAALHYSLYPASFPTQLHQLILAIQRVLSTGVKLSNLYLAGDSAGANLIFQLFSHTLHPLPGPVENPLPPSPLSSTEPLGGVCLISPWVSLVGQSESRKANAHLDIVTAKCLEYWGKAYLSSIPESQHVYVQHLLAPSAWFSGLDKLVSRVLITVGGHETLKDDELLFAEALKKLKGLNVEVDFQEGGVHADPIFDYAAKSEKLSPVTEAIIGWLAKGISGDSK